MRIFEPEHQWINPMLPDTWACAHADREPGHTTLYVIHALSSDDVLYVGITGDIRRRFKQHAKSKPWWGDSENASLECYDSWESAAEAELSRIKTWRPVHNIIGNAARKQLELAWCYVCGFEIPKGTVDYGDTARSRWPQHAKCGIAIVEAYEMGVASMLPEDDPWTVAVRRKYAEAR